VITFEIDNPYATAIEFLDKNDLDRNFLDQVAQFIIQNSKPVQFGTPAAPAYVDPYTGSSGYQTGGVDIQKQWQSGQMGSNKTERVDVDMEEAISQRFPSKYKEFPKVEVEIRMGKMY
jgi:hypothetical protein